MNGGRFMCLGLLFRWLFAAPVQRPGTGLALDYPRQFYPGHFDEGGSCRAAALTFGYSPFVGRQTIALADLLGPGPSPEYRR